MGKRKRTIYIDKEEDKQMRVAAVEDDKFYGEYADEAFRLFLDKRRFLIMIDQNCSRLQSANIYPVRCHVRISGFTCSIYD